MGLNIPNSQVVGIDLGTGFTLGAYLDDTGAPKIIPSLDGSLTIHSVVHFSAEGKVTVGEAASNMRFIEPDRTFFLFKPDVGSDVVYAEFNGLKITPEWCQAQMLKYVRESCIEYTGDKFAATKVVITVPARFGEKQRQSVCHSADMVGMQVLALINEPTSGGIALGLNQRQGEHIIALPDWGTGTYDISLAQYSGGEVQILASCGDTHLGGRDVDNLLLSMVNDRFKHEHGIEISEDSCPEDFYPLLEQVIRAKHLLSSKQETKLIVRAQGKQVVLDITRDQLSHIVEPLMQRIGETSLQVLSDGKVDIGDIDLVAAIGGSSKLKAFQAKMADLFGKDKCIGCKISPEMCVAEGAAVKAAQIISESGDRLVDKTQKVIPPPILKTSDVMPHSLGVLAADKVSGALSCSVILPKNTTVPCKISKTYGSSDATQSRFLISVVQGEEDQLAEECVEITEKKILALPPRSPDEPSLELTMGYDPSGMANVTVRDMISGHSEDLTIDFYVRKNQVS